MKRNELKKPKIDLLFVILLAVLLVGFFVVNSFVSTDSNQQIITQLPDSYKNLVNKLVINEVMTNNSGTYASDTNSKADYIEIFNGTSKTVNLDGYGLSDKKNKIKWAFSNVKIGPGEYIVVSLTGKLEPGMNASFKLSSKGGENVILTNPNGKIIDAVETVALGKDQCMARDENGQWMICEYGTPGFENSMAGLQSYVESLNADPNEEVKLVINEFLPKNSGNFINEYGKLDGYIEVKNISREIVNLGEYTLSNTDAIPFRFVFDDITLNPGEVYCLYTGSGNVVNDKYTGFTLSKKTGCVVLGHNGKIVQNISYENLPNGMAYVRNESGGYYTTNNLSAGYNNTTEGMNEFADKYLNAPKDLIINEVMNNNTKYLPHNGNKYYDWIEFYNNSSSTITLSDYAISTDDVTLTAFNLPAVTLEPGNTYILMCSGDTNLSTKSYKHANFKISDYESLYLTKGDKLIDCMFVANVPKNYSYGRVGTKGFFYIKEVTPKASNNEGNRFITSKPVLGTAAGIYNGVDSIKLNIAAEGTIYYTTDGSIPTTSSKVYTGPIVLKKTTVVRIRAKEEGKIISPTVTASYIVNENHNLPVMSISMKWSDYNTVKGTPWRTVQKQCNAEFFEESGSFNIPCSFALFGGNSRYSKKKSYALRFDKQWGASNLVYPVFDSRDNSVYDALVIRSGSDDAMEAIMRDVLATSLADEHGAEVETQAYKTCILYINGSYFGIYNLREKVNGKFLAQHYNVDPAKASIFRIDGVITCGSNTSYKNLVSYVRSHDMSVNSNYEYVCSKINIQSVVDFWILEMYLGNRDVLNIRLFRHPDIDEGRWHYILFDTDRGFESRGNLNYYTKYLANPRGITGFINNTYDNSIPRKLFSNSEFRKLWLERLNYHLTNTYSKENLKARLKELNASIEKDLPRDRAHWGVSMSTYNAQINEIKTFIASRQGNVLSQTKAFFGLSDSQMKKYFGDLW